METRELHLKGGYVVNLDLTEEFLRHIRNHFNLEAHDEVPDMLIVQYIVAAMNSAAAKL